MRTRSTRDLCQTCWQDRHPGEYAPVSRRWGSCAACGSDADVIRSTIAAEEPCDRCGHPIDGHRSDLCDTCEDAAQVGQYAPCARADRRPCAHEPNEAGTACRFCGLAAVDGGPVDVADLLAAWDAGWNA